MRIPAATVNALVQRVIPPPKYQIDRLVRGVQLGSTARLAGLIVIQRERGGQLPLASYEAHEILMRNCEDAYGFPPYPAIETFLHARNGKDLRLRERGIVARAMGDLPSTLLRSETRDWWRDVVAVIDETLAGPPVLPRVEPSLLPQPAIDSRPAE
jgi:hypothetical protein